MLKQCENNFFRFENMTWLMQLSLNFLKQYKQHATADEDIVLLRKEKTRNLINDGS